MRHSIRTRPLVVLDKTDTTDNPHHGNNQNGQCLTISITDQKKSAA